MSIHRKFGDFFGLGRIPEKLKKELAGDGLLFMAEGIPATAIFRSYKAVATCVSYRSILLFGFLAITERRLVTEGGSYDQIDIKIPFDDPKFKGITFKVEKKRLVLDYDAAALQPNASGRITIRYPLQDPQVALDILKSKGAKTVPET